VNYGVGVRAWGISFDLPRIERPISEDDQAVDNTSFPVDNSGTPRARVVPEGYRSPQVAGVLRSSAQEVDKPVDKSVGRYSDTWSERIRDENETADGVYLAEASEWAGTGPGGLFVHGAVRGSGDSVPGAVLTLTDSSGRQVDRGTADEQGHFRLTVRTGGTYVLIASAGRFQPAATMVAVADKPVRRDVELEGSGGLSGVVYSRGRPVPGATVVLTDARGDVVSSRITGSGGGYSFRDLVGGSFAMTVTAAGYRPSATAVTVPEGRLDTVDVELRSGTRLSGVVRTETSGRAVPEAQVTLLDPDGTVVASTLTDEDGGYSFADLFDGEYTVIAAGYPPAATQLRVDGAELTHDPHLGYSQA